MTGKWKVWNGCLPHYAEGGKHEKTDQKKGR